MNAIELRHRRWVAILAACFVVGTASTLAGAQPASPQGQHPSQAKQSALDKGKERQRQQQQQQQAHRQAVQQPRRQPSPPRPVQPGWQPPSATPPQRLSREQQERLRVDRERADQLRAQEQRTPQRREEPLQPEKRIAQRRYEEGYYRRLLQHRVYWDAHRYDPGRDPYYYTPPVYRYRFDGRYYRTNRYGAHLMQLAVNFGYQEGLRAGMADREDGWDYDYRSNDAYRDASYGYYGYYLGQLQYRYYFREGFRRGYDDGYYGRYRYGRVADDGTYVVLAAILGAILGLQPL